MTNLLLSLMALLLIASLERSNRRHPPRAPGLHGSPAHDDRDCARTKPDLPPPDRRRARPPHHRAGPTPGRARPHPRTTPPHTLPLHYPPPVRPPRAPPGPCGIARRFKNPARGFKMKDVGLAPCFLLSMPQLADSNFVKSVILLCDHSAEGAFGLVVNRLSERTAASSEEQTSELASRQ